MKFSTSKKILCVLAASHFLHFNFVEGAYGVGDANWKGQYNEDHHYGDQKDKGDGHWTKLSEGDGHRSKLSADEIFAPPATSDKAATARWLVHNTDWCSLSTINSRYEDLIGMPFGNIASFSDGAKDASTGTIYMLHAGIDATMIDVSENPAIGFSISEAQTGYCRMKKIDSEDPRCARLSITGHLILVPDDEIETAKTAVFSKHPAMKEWYTGAPSGHDFKFWKIEMHQIWLIDFYGGAALVDADAWERGTDDEDNVVKPSSIKCPYANHKKNGDMSEDVLTEGDMTEVIRREESSSSSSKGTTETVFFIGTFMVGAVLGLLLGLKNGQKKKFFEPVSVATIDDDLELAK